MTREICDECSGTNGGHYKSCSAYGGSPAITAANIRSDIGAKLESLPPWMFIASTTNSVDAIQFSQAISLKRIADALEKIAEKPAFDPAELQSALYNGISEAGYAVTRNMKG